MQRHHPHLTQRHAGRRSVAMTCALFGALVVAAVAGPVRAERLFVAPEGCAAYMTTQNRSCRVVHYWRCPDIDADDQWRIVIERDRTPFISRIDENAQWVESGPEHNPQEMGTLRPIPDAGNFDELVTNGLDTFDFYQRPVGGMVERITGFDRIIGEVVIDGEPLLQTEYQMVVRDWQGEVAREIAGKEYISVTHRRFFSGVTTKETFQGREMPLEDHSPVEFHYPGDAGFGAMEPAYDCDLMGALPRAIGPVGPSVERG